ncbi:transposase [Mesorhizobium sophorae]|uniref:transposase n=1 Tax=Mesorhizobium sophorae TaxID=1300294 RepID=UPI000BA3B01C|nr:transposase [Mesorhizobium sophorae]
MDRRPQGAVIDRSTKLAVAAAIAPQLCMAAERRPDRTVLAPSLRNRAELSIAGDLARRFAALIRGDDDTGLDQWIEDATDSERASLAAGIGRDIEAVRAAITQPWSTSPVEGQINRLKTIKRQMYGRSGYPLLRNRLLAAA